MNSSFPNRWSFSYLKFTKYVTNIIAEPKYKYGQQEQVTVRNHNRKFKSYHEIMALFVFRNLILQTRMCSHPMGLDVWFLVGPFVHFHTSWVRTAKALARLRGCEDSSEPSLVAYVVSTKIPCAGSNVLRAWYIYILGQKSNGPLQTIDCKMPPARPIFINRISHSLAASVRQYWTNFNHKDMTKIVSEAVQRHKGQLLKRANRYKIVMARDT